jgi:hypothetical protein
MNTKDFLRKLFELEFQVLEDASTIISSEKFQDNELLASYKSLADNYEKLLSLTRKITTINDSQARSLLQREIQIQRLLDNAEQGFLTFGKDLLVNQESSAACQKIFGRKINGSNIHDILDTGNQNLNQQLETTISTIFSSTDSKVYGQLTGSLPKSIPINGRNIEIDLKVIYPSFDQDLLVMLILCDITEKQKAQEEIVFLSYHDKLTGLYNRAFIDNWLKDRIQMKILLYVPS